MKIAIWGMKEWEREYTEKALAETSAELSFFDGVLNTETLPSQNDSEIISVFVDSRVEKAVLDHFPNLRGIVTRSTGFDHIACDECKARNIVVSTVPSYGENTVAEFAFALILALSRKVFSAVDTLRKTGVYSYEGMTGFDLKGKTLGVVGSGRIGLHTIKIAKGFEMNVVASDAYPNTAKATELGFTYLPFEELLKVSDIVSIHVPALPETEHMFNETTLPMMKKGALLINTARGAVVKTSALLEVLRSGHLAGAGLDVVEEERALKEKGAKGLSVEDRYIKELIEEFVLVDNPKVLLTPHAAFDTQEALERILNTSIEDVRAIMAGNPMNTVK